MTLNYDEISLIAMYKEKNRRDTVRRIAEMSVFLSPDQWELIDLTEKTIRKLKAMSDEDYENIDLDSCYEI